MKHQLLFGCASLGLVACAGARTTVTAPTSEYPVSLSRAVRDSDGKIVPLERRQVVGHFKESYTAWNLIWSAVKLTPEKDISEDVNKQVAATHGDAIVHLTIVTSHCPLNYFAFPFALIPFWPTCADLDVDGDIVRVSDAKVVDAKPEEKSDDAE